MAKKNRIKIIEPVVCLCCGKILKSLHDNSYGMVMDGMIAHFMAPYGSCLDGDIYQIAICDDCVRRKEKENKIVLAGNYIFGEAINHRGEIVKVEYCDD